MLQMGKIVLASGLNTDDVVYVWDAETFEPLGEVKAPHQEMVRAMVAINSTTLWMGSADKTAPLSIWTVMALKDRRRVKKQKKRKMKKKAKRTRTAEEKEKRKRRESLMHPGLEFPKTAHEEREVSARVRNK